MVSTEPKKGKKFRERNERRKKHTTVVSFNRCREVLNSLKPSLILKAIPIIDEGEFSFDEFAAGTGLGGTTSTHLAGFLARSGIGRINSSNYIEFGPLDRMHAAIFALRTGADIEELSKVLNWRDFEVLATKMLEAGDYVTYRGLRLKKPRAEIDAVGIRDRMALLIDCKHWKQATPSALRRFVLKQVERAEAFARANEGKIEFAIPAILTLHMESIAFAEGVPIIPIIKFRSFLNEMHGYLGEMRRVAV